MPVMTGLDILAADGCQSLLGQRVGVITNHTAITRDRRHIVDILLEAGVEVVALFGPEHGIRGDHDEGERVSSGVDPKTRLQVHSLFGSELRPHPETLASIDTLVFDIADVGARYYTYTTTMAYCMEEASWLDIRFVVLDRPNPITGTAVDGPVMEPAFQDLVAYHPIPTRHGLTPGELAQYANSEYGMNCRLEVIPCQGWKRSMWFDETGLPWVSPSPNLRNLNQATLYCALAGFEFSEVSVGRGTETPFEVFGAPYMDALEVAERLNALGNLHLRFVPIEFTPDGHVYSGERCQGCFVLTTNRDKLRPAEANIRIAYELRKLYPRRFDITRSQKLLGGQEVAEAIKKGRREPEKLIAEWKPKVDDYLRRRERYLLYQ